MLTQSRKPGQHDGGADVVRLPVVILNPNPETRQIVAQGEQHALLEQCGCRPGVENEPERDAPARPGGFRIDQDGPMLRVEGMARRTSTRSSAMLPRKRMEYRPGGYSTALRQTSS